MEIQQLQQMKVKELDSLLQQTAEQTLPELLMKLQQDERHSVQNLIQRYQRQLEKKEKERQRIAAMWQYEQQAKAMGNMMIAGTDDVGRGPLAGPVVAAAVILPEDADLPEIKDSKKLSEKQRIQLDKLIKKQAIAWAIAEVDEKTIDAINILEASRLAMRRAVEGLRIPPDLVLVDGNRDPGLSCEHTVTIVHGDALSASIAAASILAKVSRDRFMVQLAAGYPQYAFEAHKGYGTKLHYERLREYGPSPVHRSSFLKNL